MLPTTQKALVLEQKYADLVLKDDVEVYEPGRGEILVKIHATSLNPVDWKIQKKELGMFEEKFPFILGTDIAGEVVKLGEGVLEFKVGDRVFCQGRFENAWSGFQQYALLAASATARIPESWTYEQAAALPVVLSAAYNAFYNVVPHGLGLTPPLTEEKEGVYSRTPIVILGGASSVGQIALQLAKLSGFSPIITTASSKHADNLKRLGATDVLDRNLSGRELKAEIDKITGGKPIKYAFDSISSAATQQVGVEILSPSGTLATVLPVVVDVPEDKNTVSTLGIFSHSPQHLGLLETLYHDKITGWLERGVIRSNEIEILPNGLLGIPDGMARMEADQVSGRKLVARPQETP
ncbi:GroES-like protein [Agrocybe pediades]|nr:GroES-like protein [Agrocybe pediades]